MRIRDWTNRTPPRPRGPSAYELLAISLALLALGGVGYAAIPSADGTIKSCYATTNGLLLGIPHSKGDARIVDAAQSCRSYEAAVSWQQHGPTGLSGYEIVTAEGAPDTNQLKPALAVCPAGKKVIGGGGGATTPSVHVITRSEPRGDDGWSVVVRDLDPDPDVWGLHAYAICADVGP